jgi:hypothetical protein
LWGVVPLSLMFHGRVELVHVRGYARAPTKPHELGVYDHGRVSYLSCAQGSYISCSGRGIRHGVHGVLRVDIWCAITAISPLPTMVLWLGSASLDSFDDPTYCGLCDPA